MLVAIPWASLVIFVQDISIVELGYIIAGKLQSHTDIVINEANEVNELLEFPDSSHLSGNETKVFIVDLIGMTVWCRNQRLFHCIFQPYSEQCIA